MVMDDDYDYSLDGYVSTKEDELLRKIKILRALREEQERLEKVAQMFLQDLIEVILAAGAKTEDAEEKFNKLIE